jgi:6-phosphogluconolactonase
MNITYLTIWTNYTKSSGYFVELSEKSIRKHHKFVVALSGGSSPKAVFQIVGNGRICPKDRMGKIYFLG